MYFTYDELKRYLLTALGMTYPRMLHQNKLYKNKYNKEHLSLIIGSLLSKDGHKTNFMLEDIELRWVHGNPVEWYI